MARRSLLFNSTVYVVGRFASLALWSVQVVVFTRFLDKEDFGITGTLNAYGSVLGVILVLGLHSGISRHYFDLKHDPTRLKSYLTSVYVFQLVMSVVLMLVLELTGEWLWRRATSGSIPFSYVRLMLWSTLLVSVAQIPQALYQSEEKSATVVTWQLAPVALLLGFGIVFVAVLDQHALGALRSQLVASAVIAAILITQFLRTWGSRDLQWSHVRTALLFSLPLLPHVLGSILMQTVDRVMLEKYASQAEVGIYSLAMQLGTLLGLVAGGVNQAWGPHFLRTSTEEAPDDARSKAEVFASLFVALFTGLSLVGALLAHELLHILGEKWLPALPYVIVFVIGTLIGIYYFLPANQLFLAARTRWFLIATGTATFVSVGLNAWLLPRGGGGMVAVWIFVAGSACQAGIVFLAARLYAKPLLGVRHGIVIVLAMAALAIATREPSLPLRLALLAGSLVVIYVLLVRGNLRVAFPRAGHPS